VQDMHNAPLKDIRVQLVDTGGLVAAQGYTSATGNFEFSSVNPGLYTVVASAGLAQSSERVDATALNSFVVVHLSTGDTPQEGGTHSISVAQLKVPDKARSEFRKATEAMEKHKFDEASKHIEKALSLYSNYADALTLRGVLSLNQHKPEAAIADLDQAIKADPNYAMAYLVMGSALNMQSKFDEAIKSLERGETLLPTAWQAHFEMGKAYIGKEDFQSAIDHLERAREMSPSEYPLIYLLEAHAHLSLKQYPQAMTALQSYLQKEPQGPNRAEAQKMLEQAQANAGQNKP